MYYANTLICHPDLIAIPGEQVRNCPPALLRQLIEDKCVYQKAEDTPDESLISDVDVLTHMTRKQLIQVCKLNDLRKFFDPKSSWTDDMLRQAIRDVAPNQNVEEFTLPEEAKSEPDPPASNK